MTCTRPFVSWLIEPRSAAMVFVATAMLVMAGCEHATRNPAAPSAATASDPTVTSTTAASGAVAAKAGVVLCHRTEGSNGFVRISVAESAVAAHLAHGDGRVGEAVPGYPDRVFGPDCSPVPAPTGPISFRFSGQVTEVRDPSDVLAGSGFSPAAGDAILGDYTINPAAPGIPLSPETTHYLFSPTPPFGMTFQIGSTNFEAFPGSLSINVSNDEPSVGDRYSLFTSPTAPALVGITWMQVGFELGTTTNLDVFDSTALPLVLPDISLFNTQNEFFLSFISATGDLGFVVGRLSSTTRTP